PLRLPAVGERDSRLRELTAIAAAGGDLYATRGPRLGGLDRSQPGAPRPLRPGPGGRPRARAVSGALAWPPAHARQNPRVVDVSNPEKPQQVAQLDVPSAAALAMADRRAFVLLERSTRGPGALQVIDLADPANPRLAATLPLADPTALTVAGGYAYVAEHG